MAAVTILKVGACKLNVIIFVKDLVHREDYGKLDKELKTLPMGREILYFAPHFSLLAPKATPLFFRLSSNEFPDFGSVGRH